MNLERPAGIIAMSAVCILAAFVSLIYAALIVAGRVPLSAGAFLLGGGFEQLGPLAFMLYGAVLVVLAVGLWKRWRWARQATILLAVAGIAFAVPAISSAVGDSRIFAITREGLQIMVRVLVVFYLSQEPVRHWFAMQA